MAGKSAKSAKDGKRRVVCENRRARFDYEILETLEVGISLLGSEVKSVRNGSASIAEAHVRFEHGEAWLVNSTIAIYEQASSQNHDPCRRRKLLLHRAEIEKWFRRVRERGQTAVPLRVFFQGPWIKMEIALCKGKQQHDKRAALKAKNDRREIQRAMRTDDRTG
jgi:SsrA-binding protein